MFGRIEVPTMNRILITLLAAVAAVPVYAQAPAAAPAPAEKRADAEKRLEAAREQLEEAAREVAQISAEIGAPVIERFMSSYGLRRSFIGVQLDSSGGKDGARIDEVSPGGPAEKAGLRRGDVIVAVNGTDLKGGDSASPVRELTRRLREIEPESKVKLRILRDGKPQEVEVTTRSAHGLFAMPPLPPMPPVPMPPDMDFDPGEHFDFRSMLRNELSGMELSTLSP